MPISITVDEARHRIYVATHGNFTYADALSYLEQRRDRGLLGYSALIDCDGADTDLTTDEVRSLVDLRQRLMQQHQVGPTVLVAQRDVLFGMLRMYQILTDDTAVISVARTREEAERWLDGADGTTR